MEMITIIFNPDTKELSFVCDNDSLIIEGFLKDTNGLFVTQLKPRGQKMLIKKLVNNLDLD